MDRINELVKEYNDAEAQQAQRLRELFALIKRRKGWRYIKFDNANMLCNCWGSPDDRQDGETYLKKYAWGIMEVLPGAE